MTGEQLALVRKVGRWPSRMDGETGSVHAELGQQIAAGAAEEFGAVEVAELAGLVEAAVVAAQAASHGSDKPADRE